MTNAEILEMIETLRDLVSVRNNHVCGECYEVDKKWEHLIEILKGLVGRDEPNDISKTAWAISGVESSQLHWAPDTDYCKLTLETTRPISFTEQAVRMCELNRPVTIVIGDATENPKENVRKTRPSNNEREAAEVLLESIGGAFSIEKALDHATRIHLDSLPFEHELYVDGVRVYPRDDEAHRLVMSMFDRIKASRTREEVTRLTQEAFDSMQAYYDRHGDSKP